MKTRIWYWMLPLLGLAGSLSCDHGKKSSLAKNVFGMDSRTELDVSTFPGKAVARLDGGCSAAIIGKKLALTAAHCVFDSEKSALREDVRYLTSGYKNGVAAAKTWISQVWIGTTTPETTRKNDWAILILSDDIGSTTGWFGIGPKVTEASLPMSVSMAGYGSDKGSGKVPQLTSECYLHKIDAEERVLHDCDGVTGVSGGPIFLKQAEGGATIISITAAEFRNGGQSENRATYSHEYANIAVNATRFASAAETLVAAASNGAAITAIESATHFTNMNSTAGQDDDNVPVVDNAALREKTEKQLKQNSMHIYDSCMIITEAASAIVDYANYFGYQDLRDSANTAGIAAGKLTKLTWLLYYGQLTAAEVTDSILEGVNTLASANETLSKTVANHPRSVSINYDLKAPLEDMNVSTEGARRFVQVEP